MSEEDANGYQIGDTDIGTTNNPQDNRLGEKRSELNEKYGRPGEKVLLAYCNERWDGSSVMYPPVPNLRANIDLLQIDDAEMTNSQRENRNMSMQYEAEVCVFRALEKLRKHCLVLHGIEYKHFLYEQVYSFHECTSQRCRRESVHACHKESRSLEGETDFLVIGPAYFVIIEVKDCMVANIGNDCNLDKAKTQAKKAAKLLQRIMLIMENDGSINPVFQFYAFPFLNENEAQPFLPETVDLSGNTRTAQQPKTILFEDVFTNFDQWWEENVEAHVGDFKPLSRELKAAVIGMAGSTENFDIGPRIKTIDENLRKSKITRENKKGRPVLKNAHVHEACNEMRSIDICYITHDQKLALDREDNVLILNGPAGVGKTVILLTKLMQMALDTNSDNKIVLFTLGHQAALFHKSSLERAGITCSLMKIKNNTSSEEFGSLLRERAEKVLIFSIAIFAFPVEFLVRINAMVKLLKNHCVFMDDVQCFVVPSSTKTSHEYYSNVSHEFQELMTNISECSFARIAIDTVQLFYFPNSENSSIVVAEAINNIKERAEIVKLQSNLRNSYEMSHLLTVIREQLKNQLHRIEENLMPPQNFSHYIHGNKPVIHVLSTTQRAKFKEKIIGVVESELRLLGVGRFRRRNGIAEEQLQIMEFKNIRDFDVADSHKFNLKDILTSGTTVEMIRNCYSREWAAVIALIWTCNMTHKEFLSRVYLAASRARVYCSLIFFMRESKPPQFFSDFLESVESSDVAIVKKYEASQPTF